MRFIKKFKASINLEILNWASLFIGYRLVETLWLVHFATLLRRPFKIINKKGENHD